MLHPGRAIPSIEIPDQPARRNAFEKKNPGKHFSLRTAISRFSERNDDVPMASESASGISPNQERASPVMETEAVSKADGLG